MAGFTAVSRRTKLTMPPALIAEKDFAGRQSQGARALQEDSYAFSEIVDASGQVEGLLVVVADGMGGHAAGERASELALKNFVDAFHQSGGPITKRMSKGLAAANEAIRNELQREPDCEGMGTTLVAASVTTDGVEWISVGDSPLYLLRGANLKRLNEDHSLRPVLHEMSKRGQLSNAPERASGNLLRAALTGEEIALTDQSPGAVTLQDRDLILVATDGIHTLNDQEIAATCLEAPATEARALAARLMQAVLDAGNPKQDNTTIAILRPRAEEDGLVLPL
jgi:serine/threonine protein phosphatase PrpC